MHLAVDHVARTSCRNPAPELHWAPADEVQTREVVGPSACTIERTPLIDL